MRGASNSLEPPISLAKAKVSYFIHDGKAQSVANCNSDVFKEAVLSLSPHWKSHETYAPVLLDSLDIYTRWYLLCGLAECERGMMLYTKDELQQLMSVRASFV